MSRPKPITLPPLKAYAKRCHATHGWYWQIVYQGRTGDTAWAGYATASEVTRRMADLIASGVTEERDEQTPAGVTTVGDLLDYWLGSSVDPRVETGALAQSSAHAYTAASKHLARILGGVQLYALDRTTLDRYDVTRVREGYAPGTVHHERVTLSAAWRWGVEQGLCPHRSLARPTVRPKPRESYLPSRQEVAQVLAHIQGWHLVALRIQHATGARASEVGHLRMRDVDFDTGEIRIPKGKTGARAVPVAPVVLELVRRWVDEHRQGCGPDAQLLVDAPAQHTAPGLNTAIHRACGKAGLPRWSTHALRYRAVCDMIDAGVDPKTASEITGHSLATMLGVYRRVTSEGKRQAVQLARLGYLPAPGEVIDFNTGKRRR